MLRGAVICAAAQVAAAARRGAASTLSTLVGAPEVVGGPTCCLFDSPLLALRSVAGTVGLTANGATAVYSRGATVDATLPSPLPTGLAPDADAASYSHCGKWLNAAFVDFDADPTGATVHGFFHQVRAWAQRGEARRRRRSPRADSSPSSRGGGGGCNIIAAGVALRLCG
jgi:hypothetical protein